jgi:glycosyltransferase involved in cell wall biosynthesis
MCWNQGDWRFYYHYKKWHKTSLKIALDILNNNSIHIIHQLNMIGFREPGFLWKIPHLPFVWGPVGGMDNIPLSFLKGSSLTNKIKCVLKNFINIIQIRFSLRVIKAIRRANILFAAVRSVKDIVEPIYKREVILLNETGCKVNDYIVIPKKRDTFNIVWVGKFDFRKQLNLALNVISNLKNLEGVVFHIIGSGTKEEEERFMELSKKMGLEDITVWHGQISHNEVQKIMRFSHLLFFTSIMEGTPHVVLEAISNNLPVVCFDTCGQSEAVNNEVGFKINLSNPKTAISDFTYKIRFLYENRDVLNKMSIACNARKVELSWDSKAKIMFEYYKKSILN